ncbi:MAG: class I SAM-dependent methyltransferase [Nocardioides sp.]
MSLSDPVNVRRQYADEGNLSTRARVWQPAADGREPGDLALSIVGRARRDPGRREILEVGCGTGAFAARLAEMPDTRVFAVDQSERFVRLTRDRGVEAHVADVQHLPFADSSFDTVAALWMLYHVADLHRALGEIRRVLRPGGTFVAVTNGDEHVADLRRDAGGAPVVTRFSSENGESSLRQHFDGVRREDVATRAVFPDHAAAVAYLESSLEGIDWRLPAFDGPREYAGHVTVFVAS